MQDVQFTDQQVLNVRNGSKAVAWTSQAPAGAVFTDSELLTWDYGSQQYVQPAPLSAATPRHFLNTGSVLSSLQEVLRSSACNFDLVGETTTNPVLGVFFSLGTKWIWFFLNFIAPLTCDFTARTARCPYEEVSLTGVLTTLFLCAGTGEVCCHTLRLASLTTTTTHCWKWDTGRR
jgi:hypothetical protein